MQLTLEMAVASLDQAIRDLVKGFNGKATFIHLQTEKFEHLLDLPLRHQRTICWFKR